VPASSPRRSADRVSPPRSMDVVKVHARPCGAREIRDEAACCHPAPPSLWLLQRHGLFSGCLCWTASPAQPLAQRRSGTLRANSHGGGMTAGDADDRRHRSAERLPKFGAAASVQGWPHGLPACDSIDAREEMRTGRLPSSRSAASLMPGRASRMQDHGPA
jgi:hypothetical protein